MRLPALLFMSLWFSSIELVYTEWKPSPNVPLASNKVAPDLFSFTDGNPVETEKDWKNRRAEIKAMMQYYQYGHLPPRPDQVTATIDKKGPHRSGQGQEEWITLSIHSQHQLKMRLVLYSPDKPGKHPAIIREEGNLGRSKIVSKFLEKGYSFIEYARHDLDPDRNNVVGHAQKAYPEYDWATLAVWAWGGMRVVDYLETRPDIDLGRIAITGHSRGGKMALLAGALDERFSLVIPNGSGAGGAGSYRVLGPGAESLGMNDKPHWYHERIRWFGGREDQLPFDQHFLKALVAPRALLCTESLDDLFANPWGTQITSMAAREAYRFLEADINKIGLSYRRGGHDFNDEDWNTVLNFAEWHFFGRRPTDPKKYWQTPLPTPRSWSTVSTPKERQGATDPNPVLAVPNKSWSPKWIQIGKPGNAPDQDHFGQGRFGGTSQVYSMARDKVTNEEYAHFLNAVAQTDSHGLYHPGMSTASRGIVRSGKPGSYTYLTYSNHRNHPVTHVDWHDALRFCNWLHNGRPEGRQNSSTTEDGAYTIQPDEKPIVRNPTARFFLPSEDEWYKAAYFSPKSGYDQFPEGSTRPRKVNDGNLGDKSALGVRGMDDGIWEWNEAYVGTLFRGLRSGVWFQGNNRQAAGRFFTNPDAELPNIGFRVARPSTK